MTQVSLVGSPKEGCGASSLFEVQDGPRKPWRRQGKEVTATGICEQVVGMGVRVSLPLGTSEGSIEQLSIVPSDE